jgi:multimeric flavodoxin WrbA
MKITTILGSPRMQGNTATTLKLFEEKATAAGHEIKRINLAELTIAGCTGCGACQSPSDEASCVVKDDAGVVYEGLIEGDLSIIASPLYCWSFTSLVQAALERCIALVSGYGTEDFQSLVMDKTFALLMTCGGPVEDNADLAPIAFQRLSEFVKAKAGGTYILASATSPEGIAEAAGSLSDQMVSELLGSV